MTWTDERVALLRELHPQKMSATRMMVEINLATSGDLTRNAVIGKCGRLGLGQIGLGKATPRPKRPKIRKPAPLVALACTPPPMAVCEAIDLPPDEPDNPVTLQELTEFTCRFPIGDPKTPEFRFCGAMPEEGKPYCRRHCLLSYQPRERR